MKPRRVVLAIAVLLALFFAIYPIFVIRPFRAQGPRELAVALVVFRWAPLVTALCAAIAVIVAVINWFRSRWTARVLYTSAALFVVAAAVLSRVNIYERMFHPVGAPSFIAASKAGVAANDMVLVVFENRISHAYPIREIGYHHVINDWLGAVPIVATY